MDALYDNLDNYNEEHTIAELQTENKELKSKLEEYASTLETLQKDFDKLSSEYKNLEQNYSSLLKTAKAEIERKTQMITNLNLEKDNMVLNAYHKRNGGHRPYGKPMGNRDTKSERDSKMKEIERGTKPSPHTATERKEQDFAPKDTTTTKIDIKSKLLNMAYTGARLVNPRIEKNSDVKENVTQPINENGSSRSRASSIKNRRKSMPAVCMGMEELSSDDDDLASTGSCKDILKEHTDKIHVGRNLRDRPHSRISETSSLEDRKPGNFEPLSDTHKSRSYNRYKNDRIDRYKSRDKSSHRFKRYSPDRHRRAPKDYNDNPYHSSELDRRVVESETMNKNHHRRSRDPHKNSNERRHRDHEKQQHRNQEKYSLKHKTQHSYDESDNKRRKIETNYRQSVEDQRLQDERDFLEKKLMEPFDNIQFSSCESPDYNHSDISTQQIREIKFTATTNLEDPRISNKKYIVKKNDGKLALSTAEGRNVDIVPVNKTAWGIKPVSIPEALARRPSLEIEKSVNPVANLSMESGEICDFEGLNSQNRPQEVYESKVLRTEEKEKYEKTLNESEAVKNSSQKLNNYKIPRLKKTADVRQSRKNTKESTPLEKAVLENIPIDKGKKPRCIITNIDMKPSIKPDKQHETVFIQSSNELPFLGNSDLCDKQKYATAKEVVEGDLELSDDNCDNNEPPPDVSKENVIRLRLEKDTQDKNQSCNFEIVKHSTDASDTYKVNVKRNKSDNILEETKRDDGKKSKNKKKLKHKETKECVTKDFAQISEKTTKRKAKEKETKNKQIKNKNNELFDDSSSLILPEDLGITPEAPTTMLPGRCVPFLEESQDAVDLIPIKASKNNHRDEEIKHSIIEATKTDTINTIYQESVEKNNCMQPAMINEDNAIIYKKLEPGVTEKEKDVKTVITSTDVQPPLSIEKEELAIRKEPQGKTIQDIALKDLATSTPPKIWSNVVQSDVKEKLIDTNCNSNVSREVTVLNETTKTPNINIMYQDSVEKVNYSQPALIKEDNAVIYKNLEPGIPEKEKDVKTVIISTGVQPPISIDKQEVTTETEPQINTIQDIALKALATSTPLKIWSNLVQTHVEAKLTDTSCNSNDSRAVTVDNTPTLDISDTNTLDSHTNDTKVPDVRINVRRVRRRRTFIKQ